MSPPRPAYRSIPAQPLPALADGGDHDPTPQQVGVARSVIREATVRRVRITPHLAVNTALAFALLSRADSDAPVSTIRTNRISDLVEVLQGEPWDAHGQTVRSEARVGAAILASALIIAALDGDSDAVRQGVIHPDIVSLVSAVGGTVTLMVGGGLTEPERLDVVAAAMAVLDDADQDWGEAMPTPGTLELDRLRTDIDTMIDTLVEEFSAARAQTPAPARGCRDAGRAIPPGVNDDAPSLEELLARGVPDDLSGLTGT